MSLNIDSERVTVYKLTSPKLTGPLYLAYQDGGLAVVDAAAAQLNAAQWAYLLPRLPVRATEVATAELGLAVAQLVAPRSVQDKVVLFCTFFRRYRGVSYVPKLLEKANLKGVPVTHELLTVFFESALNNFTLANYTVRINQTKDHLKNGSQIVKPRFPDHYDATLERKMPEADQRDYHQHLKRLGWRLEYGPAGSVWRAPKKTTLVPDPQ